MNIQKVRALVMVEFKKLIRDPMTLAVLVLMPVGLTLIFYVALGNLYSEWDPARPDVSYFEYLVPGTMGYAVIYMGMMIALALAEYRQEGLLKRVGTTPTSPYVYLGSLLLANVLITVLQGLIVLLVSVILGVHVQIDVLGLVMVCIFLGVLAVTAVRLGLITATIAKSTGAVSGLSMLFIVPMMMFGTFLAVFDENTRAIAHFTPNFYVTESLYLLFSGSGLSEGIIWQNLLILSIVSLVLVVIGIQLFKRTEFR